MSNHQRRPIAVSRSICVIEVIKEARTPSSWYQCIISLPGRPGTFQRTWETSHGRMDAQAMRDMASWVLVTVQNAILASGGIQMSLELPDEIARSFGVEHE